MSTIQHHPAEDELLAIRCQLGEPAAFDDLIARWHAPLWSFVRRLVGENDAAKEIFQDVWVRVIRGIPKLPFLVVRIIVLTTNYWLRPCTRR